ncbi:hypothetical protein [Legionella brunensis]|uniref:Uncharacterized protein n=1 Tax=Legionella brunensis TaxID=29422 RepID=A0A0W0S3S3_9GAMM|nr:hypothetical protein [Legionella brunensis]KTC77954.1 hypothetical protein Lbru_2246 [Legionella brunensis]
MLQFIKQHPNTQFLDEDLKRAIDLQLGQMEKKQIKKNITEKSQDPVDNLGNQIVPTVFRRKQSP